ncbi:hypothetical protein QO002_003738 [Pararhizobium capsulatum DSM 1112]|uniref:DUF6894 domain-containing protein n=1 Tax=Pararhizobium capsulatum DSM 1112 TaxID=1121113 RepID=A0ABU0BTL4_9HYPH|nr:hypothetical protein [Pararhizobium capsulatum]MDQ0321600.1 hypothetical protein [Pararhizobium capsulatum DSM 1112]
MSRYFFELHNGDGMTRDHEGMELPSRDNILSEVSRIMLDIARDELPDRESGAVSVIVRDETGRAISIANLNFSSHWLD